MRKIGDETRNYRDRENEILFMDLREMGEPFEKKYIQFSDKDIEKITKTYHQWQTQKIENVPEFCYSAHKKEIEKKDYSLVPSKYIEFVNRDEQIDFDDKMKALQQEIGELLQEEKKSRSELLRVFEDLGFKIELK